MRHINDDERTNKSCLLIAGGALRANRLRIYKKFVHLAGGAKYAKIAVIPTSSAYPMDSYLEFRNRVLECSTIPKENIVLIKVAVKNDPTTDFDESVWKDNANNDEEVSKMKGVTGVWFTGGNQHRTTIALRNQDGTNSKLLNELYRLYNRGGCVFGGTSAGAALMSEWMIGGGTSYDALSDKRAEAFDNYGDDITHDNFIINRKGLGFFPHGIIDQHFDARDRVGRLLEGCFVDGRRSYGFGIAEDTALIYNQDTETINVIGKSGVFVLNTTNAIKKDLKNRSIYQNVVVSYFVQGMTYDCITKEITISDDFRQTTQENAYSPSFMKCFNRSDQIFNFVDDFLLMNKDDLNIKDKYRRPFVVVSAFKNTRNDGEYYQLRFIQQSTTKRYLNIKTNQYAFVNLLMEIHPWEESI